MSEPSTNVATPKKRTLSDEHRAKLSEVQRRRWAAGRTVSDETRARQAEAQTGHTVTEETRQKMVAAALAREARRADERLDRMVLSHVWPAVVVVPGREDYFPCVLVEAEDAFYVGRDAFATQQDAMAVAVSRARQRMEDADGRG